MQENIPYKILPENVTGYNPEDAPKIPPRPIIICDRCTTPFDCKRKVNYDPSRCPKCGEKHNPGDAIFERKHVARHVRENHDQEQNSYSILYILEAENGLLKIGITNNLDRRMMHLQVNSPLNVGVVESFEVEDARHIESEIHKILSEENSHGEWFELENRPLDSLLDSVKMLVKKHRSD